MNSKRARALLALVREDVDELVPLIEGRIAEIEELERLVDLGGDLAADAGPQWMRAWVEFAPLADKLEAAHLALSRRDDIAELLELVKAA